MNQLYKKIFGLIDENEWFHISNVNDLRKSKSNIFSMAYVFYDFETSGRSARFDQILQAGFIIYDDKFREINKLNIKSRINSDTVPSINALRVNRLQMSIPI